MRGILVFKRAMGWAPLLALGACLSPSPRAPAPLDLTVDRSAEETVQVAAVTLGVNGFNVKATDKRTVTGVRARSGAGNDELLACPLPAGSQGRTAMRTVMTVTVVTEPTGAAKSEAIIRSSVETTFPELAPSAVPARGTADCVSNGTVERRIADALRFTSTADR